MGDSPSAEAMASISSRATGARMSGLIGASDAGRFRSGIDCYSTNLEQVLQYNWRYSQQGLQGPIDLRQKTRRRKAIVGRRGCWLNYCGEGSAGVMSVLLKSSPLKSSGSAVALARA